jgi:hypothetical protein
MTFLLLSLMWLESDEQLINDLGHCKYRIREQASFKLGLRLSLGKPDNDSLYRLIKLNRTNPNVEISYRANVLFWKYKEKYFRGVGFIEILFRNHGYIPEWRLKELKCDFVEKYSWYDYESQAVRNVMICKTSVDFNKTDLEEIENYPLVISVSVVQRETKNIPSTRELKNLK